MRYIGIDYSLTSPAITILNDTVINDASLFESGRSFYLTETKKYEGKFRNITGSFHKPYTNNIHRYENIAFWAISLAMPDDIVYIEDYSLGSTGKTFNIAENTAVLKYMFFKKHINIVPIPPSRIKKFATGKGNATKDMMYEQFRLEGNPDLYSLLSCDSVRSPLSDVVDSYWIAKYAKESKI